MTDYVLVHGAWYGAWCWGRVRHLLIARGHDVFTPTLSGLADRSHLLSRDVGLETHIADVANLLTWQDLRDVVLVGHSYGGVVVRHVADRMPDRIRSLVYLDAFVPDDGKALLDYLPDRGEVVRELALGQGDGWKVPPIPAIGFGVNEADRSWVDGQTTMHPLLTLETPARISGECDKVANIGYILAHGFDSSPFHQFHAVAGARHWWQEDLPCGHIAMLDAPESVAELLLRRT